MEPVTTQVLDGLLEGLVLHAIREDPSHGYGILKDLEAAMGDEPSKNRVYRLLRDLEEAGYVESEEVTEDSRTRQVYSLTDDGTERLAAYRELPAPFKEWLSGLFGLGNGRSPDPEAGASAEATEGGAGAGRGEEAWVEARLEDLPAEATVQARHAEYGLERSPGEGRWRFVVDRHDPGDYEGADVCPLSFVYMAIQRLLYEKRP